MSFGDFEGRRTGASIARITDLAIGSYHLPPQKIFIVGSGISADLSRQTETAISGLLGADLLAAQHGIIDLEGMSLFLK
jgi:hypothetical protein